MALTQQINLPSGTTLNCPTGLFINNEFVPSVDSRETLECINPATEDVICSVVAGPSPFSPCAWALIVILLVCEASVKDIDVAVQAARDALKTTWGKNVTGFERSRLIHKLADLIERDAQALAELETLNNGKPLKVAR